MAFKNTKTSRNSENKTNLTVHEARLFRGSIVETKHRGFTSLTFMELVPGADRVVRHICIRCIKVREIAVCGFMLLNDGYQKEHMYFHTSLQKTLVPFALSRLGFIVFFGLFFLTLVLSLFLSFFLCPVPFFLSLCFPKHIVFFHSLLQGT